MKWLRQNLVMLISFVVVAVLFALILWLQQRSAAHSQAIQAELKKQSIRLQNIGSSKLFPSSENLKRLEENRERLAQTYSELKRTVSQPLNVPVVDPVKFANLLAQKVARLNEEAAGANVKLPDAFFFSFDEYRTRLAPEDKQKLALLTRQLLAIEKLSEMMIQSGIEEIRGIKRTDTELASAKGLYVAHSFDLEFACSTPAFRSFFRGLTESDWFFIVKTLNISVQQMEVAASRRPEMGGPSSSPPIPAGGLPVPPMPGAFGGPVPPMPGAPPMAGVPGGPPMRIEVPETTRRNRLQVSMRVDLVEFLASQSQPAKTAADRPK